MGKPDTMCCSFIDHSVGWHLRHHFLEGPKMLSGHQYALPETKFNLQFTSTFSSKVTGKQCPSVLKSKKKTNEPAICRSMRRSPHQALLVRVEAPEQLSHPHLLHLNSGLKGIVHYFFLLSLKSHLFKYNEGW